MSERSLLEQWDIEIPSGPTPDKTYVGRRAHAGRADVTVIEAGEERPLPPCGDRQSVSYEWGYNGAGPTALAAALLADHLGYEAPIDTTIQFRRQVVSRLRSNGWALTSSDVASWLGTILTWGRR